VQQPLRAPRVLGSRARSGGLQHVHGARRDAGARSSAFRCGVTSSKTCHVRRRLANYGADSAVTTEMHPARKACRSGRLAAMHAPVRYTPVETDRRARAARRMRNVLAIEMGGPLRRGRASTKKRVNDEKAHRRFCMGSWPTSLPGDDSLCRRLRGWLRVRVDRRRTSIALGEALASMCCCSLSRPSSTA